MEYSVFSNFAKIRKSEYSAFRRALMNKCFKQKFKTIFMFLCIRLRSGNFLHNFTFDFLWGQKLIKRVHSQA